MFFFILTHKQLETLYLPLAKHQALDIHNAA